MTDAPNALPTRAISSVVTWVFKTTGWAGSLPARLKRFEAIAGQYRRELIAVDEKRSRPAKGRGASDAVGVGICSENQDRRRPLSRPR